MELVNLIDEKSLLNDNYILYKLPKIILVFDIEFNLQRLMNF